MSDNIELAAQLRTDVGKGASRRLRREADLVPVVLYGAEKEPVSLSIPHKDLYKACESESFFSQIITIKTSDDAAQAIVKDLQRHPSKDRILHADFFRVRMDVEIQVEVPLHFVGEEDSPGVKLHNGQVSHHLTSLNVSCLPGNLPEYIEVDVSGLDVGDAITMSQVVLPEGVAVPELELGEDHDHMVVNVTEQHEIVEEEDVEEPAADEVEASEQSDEADDADGDDE